MRLVSTRTGAGACAALLLAASLPASAAVGAVAALIATLGVTGLVIDAVVGANGSGNFYDLIATS